MWLAAQRAHSFWHGFLRVQQKKSINHKGSQGLKKLMSLGRVDWNMTEHERRARRGSKGKRAWFHIRLLLLAVERVGLWVLWLLFDSCIPVILHLLVDTADSWSCRVDWIIQAYTELKKNKKTAHIIQHAARITIIFTRLQKTPRLRIYSVMDGTGSIVQTSHLIIWLKFEKK